ncbi:MAG TPA: hypothetical protein VG102_01405 [Candidatus Paceibacterota bacterium]|jgi:hypothetical protein|nr:hypothetical protein [Candidatus Paceibacterota bacterium]
MPPSPEYHNPKKESSGATVGIVIILLLVIAGAIYFWNEQRNHRAEALPYIPGSSSTTNAQ